jgi:outer membrane protein assembly factor BamA
MASVPQPAADDEPSRSTATTNAPSTSRSAEDDRVNHDRFIDHLIPVVIPITEPAIGYGAAGGVAYIDKPLGEEKAGLGRPNITAVGGLATENGTWGAVAGDSRYWLDDRLQTLVGGAYASVNLDFYGIGKDSRLQSDPLSYNIEPLAGFVQAKYRLGDSRVWGGLGYALATVQVEFDAPAATPGLPDFHDESQVGGLMPSLTYDSRDTIFTPTRGTYVDTTAGLFSEALGGDDEFQRVSLVGIHYLPLRPTLTLGIRGDGMMSFGDVPFYLRPFILMRGVSAMRYQGEHVAQAEAELRWQFWKRFSLVGFVGGGAAWNNFERFDETLTVLAGGTGFRYELARKYGLHVGVDVAFGPDEPIVYVQFGSAWMRP